MKILLFILLLIANTAYADRATWDASEGADGYYLYATQDGEDRHFTIMGGDTTEFQFFIAPGEYEFTISAFNEYGESERSTPIIIHTVDPYQPMESDEPDNGEVPFTPTGLELIKQGFTMILKGIKGLI